MVWGGAFAASEPQDSVVRVHLASYGSPQAISMEAAGAHKIEDNGKALTGAFTVQATSAGVLIKTATDSWQLDGDVLITAGSASTDNTVKIGSTYRFPGDLRILKKGDGLKIINHVNMDTYVAGVLPYEMSNAWPLETLKAQAVAARTYAYYRMHAINRSATEQDLTNNDGSQVYNGWNAANANCIQAVKETGGIVMQTAAGGTVYACFSASNGGYTEYAKSSGAAAKDFDYLPYREDIYDIAVALGSSSYSGKVTIPKTIAAGDIKNSGAQPYKFLREKLSSAGVNVAGITGDVTVKSIALTTPKYTGPDRAFLGARFVLSVQGKDVTLDFGSYTPSGSSGKYPFLNEALGVGSKFGMLYLRDDGSSWLLASVRYGHASGMSQLGAYQMAYAGLGYQDILSFYYLLGSATKLMEMPWPDVYGAAARVSAPTQVTVSKTAAGSTTATRVGTVKVSSSTVLNVRAGAGTTYQIVGTLKNGASVTITGESGDWYQINYGSGKGWVSKPFISLTASDDSGGTAAGGDTAQTKAGTVQVASTSVLNVRAGAGTTYKVLGTLKNGTAVTITGESGDWYKITYNGSAAYVSKSFVTVGGASSGAAVVATKTGTVKVPASNVLNVRAGAGTTYKILGTLKNGEKVTITSDTNNIWYQIDYSGSTAWVSKTYVTV
jgi:SpoIID/LytB domain protein